MSETTKEISDALMCALSTPASKVGKRLRSEPDLAEIFSVGRFKLRKSIDLLVKNGILDRRKGSGTFVKRIPAREELKGSSAFFDDKQVIPKDLFAECVDAAAEGQMSKLTMNQQISIGYWSDIQVAWRASQRFLPCLVKHLSETGNCLHLHSVVEEADKPYSIDKLVELLRKNPSNGYLFESRWADLLVKAMGKSDCPVLFTGEYHDTKNYAYVSTDMLVAIRQSIKIFKEQGFKRIGLIGLGDMHYHSWQTEVQAYKAAMFGEDLNYNAFESVESLNDAAVPSSIDAIKKLLSRNDHLKQFT
jgi:DNA-binding transcriptional regulator YhcF (GntR family)